MLATLPVTFMFSVTLLMGTIMSLTSNNWLALWIGLELNMMSFIPLIISYSSSQQNTEGAIKYFLPQALGSGILLMGGFMYIMNPTQVSYMLVIISMLIKAGMAPIHFWFPNVMSSISWSMCILLSTWQKFAPMIMLFTLNNLTTMPMVMFCSSLSALIGGIGGLNQTNLRALMAYSSINHMGWMTASSLYSFSIAITYLMIYILMVMTIMMMFLLSNTKSIMQSTSSSNSLLSLHWGAPLMTMSLAGLPPFIGFFPKWMTLQILVTNHHLMIPIFLILGSLISLYFYLSIIFSFIINFNNSKLQYKMKKSLTMLLTIIISLPMAPLMLFLYAMIMFY